MYTHTYIHTCMHACMHAYIHTCMHACMHTYIHTYIHAYIHTYIHIYIYIYSFSIYKGEEGSLLVTVRRTFRSPVECGPRLGLGVFIEFRAEGFGV